MKKIVSVRFKPAGKAYYFDPAEMEFQPGDYVIVETARGAECGEVVPGPAELPDSQIPRELKKVLRAADSLDIRAMKQNRADEKKAFSLFERAAYSNDPAPACYELGNCCRDGRGVPRSSQNAQKWYRKAAELGHAKAREALARYASGTWLPSGQGADDGRPRDDAQSVERLRRAAEQGDARAQNALGRCFIDGDGDPVFRTDAPDCLQFLTRPETPNGVVRAA